jgi:hypothetical protein
VSGQGVGSLTRRIVPELDGRQPRGQTMRVVTMLLAILALLGGAADAVAQSGQRPVAAGPAAAGGTSNANTNSLSTGSNRNTNANSNSQFLSGNNTGVNNGSLEVYSGADPYQGIVLEGSTNLPQLPVIPAPPSNFSQPYRPDAFVNNPPFLPAEMALEDAKRCRDAKASWYGGSREGGAPSIKLFYAGKSGSPPVALTMANYVGTAMATTSDGPFLAALCEAAYRAMRKGATFGIVEFNVRPKNTMFGLGFGSSGGATGLPAAGAHPYAIAATLGFGTGWSNQRVEGEVVLQLTALSGSPSASAGGSPETSSASAPAPEPERVAAPNEGAGRVEPSERAVAPEPAPAPAHVDEAPPDRTVPSTEPASAAAPRILLMSAAGSSDVKRTTSLAVAPGPSLDDRRDQAPKSRPEDEPAAQGRFAYRRPNCLEGVRKGQMKELVFGLFGTVFVERGGRIVEIQGMRLVAAGTAGFEVSEVSLAEEHGRATAYWFLFEKGRLLAWGRPEEWRATAGRYKLDLPYNPAVHPLRVEANAISSGR